MKIDWDKETGNWRVFDETGVEIATAPEVVIEGTTVLIHDLRDRHGWAVTNGVMEKNEHRILIRSK